MKPHFGITWCSGPVGIVSNDFQVIQDRCFVEWIDVGRGWLEMVASICRRRKLHLAEDQTWVLGGECLSWWERFCCAGGIDQFFNGAALLAASTRSIIA